MPRDYRKQKLIRVPIYPKSQAETDLERIRGMHPGVPTAKITKRALEIGLSRIASMQEEILPGEASS